MKSNTLNNSVAYGFSKNTYRPIVVKVLESAGYKCSIPTTTKSFAPITIKVKNDKPKYNKEISVIAYLETETMGVSMYNMLGNKDVTFISEGNLYIVDIAKLQANWSRAMAKMGVYKDGCNTTSEMSYMDPAYLKELADTVIKMPADVIDLFNAGVKKLENDMKKQK